MTNLQAPVLRSNVKAAREPWRMVRLDTVATRGSGHTPNKQHSEYWGGSIRWVSLKDTSKLDQQIITTTAETITTAGLANSSAVLHAPGSVILLRDAGVGKSAILDSEMAVSQHFIVWRCGPDLHNLFLYYLFQSMKSTFERISNGSTIKTIGLGYFRQLEIPLPTIEEQRQIARQLADADHLVLSLERLLNKKREVKQGLMERLLTGKSRLGSYEEPWQEKSLNDILSYEQPGPYLVRTTTQLRHGQIPVLTAGKTFILGYTNETHGVYDRHAVIIFDDFTTASKYVDFDFKAKSSAMKILSARTGTDLRFVFERMCLIDFPLGDHKRHWISEYSKQKILVPEEGEQRAISRVITDVDSEIQALSRRLNKANSIKQGMMQRLITSRAHAFDTESES